MIQAALGGYKKVISIINSSTVYDDTPTYYEPGYSILYPLEIEVPIADQVYMLIRKRSDAYGQSFEQLSASDLSVVVKDITTGESIPAHFQTNSASSNIYHLGWNDNPSAFIPLVLVINNSIDVNNPIVRVRVLDCFVKDVNDNKFLKYRLTINDENKLFYYIANNLNDIGERSTFTAAGREGIANISDNSDSYVVFSPFAYFREVNKEKSDFSYPLGSIFYERQKSYNNEDYTYGIEGYSHDFVMENVSLINVPYYEKAAVLLIDKHLHQEITDGYERVYIDVKVNGTLSDMEDVFRINLIRS